jgi:hypothetical protein
LVGQIQHKAFPAAIGAAFPHKHVSIVINPIGAKQSPVEAGLMVEPSTSDLSDIHLYTPELMSNSARTKE